MIRIITIVTYLGLFFSVNISFAQFSLDGQFRTRFEYRDGYKQLASESTFGVPLVFQRSRLIASYKDENLTIRVSGQDARIWGQNSTSMSSNTTHIYEAWALYRFTPKLLVKLGRQELKYDDQRVMSFNDYSLTGLTYDAALFAWENSEKKSSVHFGAMINNSGQVNFLNYYNEPLPKYMNFFWFTTPIGEKLTLNVINFIDATQRNDRVNVFYGRNTIGSNLIFKHEDIYGARVGGYYQFGKTWHSWGAGLYEKLKVSAYSFNSTIWVKPITQLTASINMDVYSGQDWSSSSSTFTSFYRMLSAGHALLGYMDYFTSKNLTEVNYAGLIDFFLKVDFSPSDKLHFNANIHSFLMEKPFILTGFPLASEKVSPGLGQEIDFVCNYKISNAFTVEGAWMVMIPTATLERFNGLNEGESQFSHFGYVSLLFTPSLFKQAKPENDLK